MSGCTIWCLWSLRILVINGLVIDWTLTCDFVMFISLTVVATECSFFHCPVTSNLNRNWIHFSSLKMMPLLCMPGWSLDLWRNAECGCSVYSNSWHRGPPNHRGCHMERVFGRVCGVGYAYMVCSTYSNGWLPQQIRVHLLVQWDCCEGTLSFLHTTLISHEPWLLAFIRLRFFLYSWENSLFDNGS